MQFAVAKLKLPDGNFTEVRVLLDSGSNRSFVSKGQGVKEKVSVKTFGGNKISSQWRECVNLELHPAFNGLPRNPVKIQALALPKVCEKLEDVPVDVKEFCQLRRLNLADKFPRSRKEVDILIGMDYYHQIMKATTVRGKKCEPVATFSIFGWILSGPVTSRGKEEQPSSNHAEIIPTAELNQTLKFLDLESIGIRGQRDQELQYR